MAKISQLDALKASLQHVLSKGAGEENPFVKGLRGQIAMHEKPKAPENPMSSRISVGFRNEGPASRTTPSTKEDGEQEDIRSESLRRLRARQMWKAPAGRT